MTDIRFLRLDLAKGCRDVGHLRLVWQPELPLWRVVEFTHATSTVEPSLRRVVCQGEVLARGFELFTDHLVALANDWNEGAVQEIRNLEGLRARGRTGPYRGFRAGWVDREYTRHQNHLHQTRRQYRKTHREFYDTGVAAGWPIGPYVEPRFAWGDA